MKKFIIPYLLLLMMFTSCGTYEKATEPITVETEITTENIEPPKRKSIVDTYKENTEKNATSLDLNNMTALESIDLEKYNIYLIGEDHGVSANNDLKIAFTKYLNKNQGMRYIMEEVGYCNTILLNEFLKTGDIDLLISYIDNNKNSRIDTNETYDYYMELYEYNKTLATDEQIVLVGVDVQHNWKLGLSILNDFKMTEKETPELVENVFEIIGSEFFVIEEILLAMDIVENNSDIFKEYFENEYTNFYFGLRSIYQRHMYYSTANEAMREKYIWENFTSAYSQFEIDKSFGMFGKVHVWLNHGVGQEKSMANYLNTEFEPTKNKVFSINCVYNNCSKLIPASGDSTWVNESLGSISSILAESIDTNYGICPSGELIFENKPLSDKFQYMLCVKNSPAYTVFNKEVNK